MPHSSYPPMILVLGVTGVGKSTFISAAEPSNGAPTINDSLLSSQAQVAGFEVQHGGQTLLLVDTPGFNDTDRSDREVLHDIKKFLNNNEGREVIGIIYLVDPSIRDYHPVSLQKFRAPPSVVVATVQGAHGLGGPSDAQKAELRHKYRNTYHEDHFGGFRQKEAALSIIRRVVEKSTPVPVEKVIRDLDQILQERTPRTEHFFHKLFRFFKP